MNNWKKVTLNDIGKIVTGKTPKTKNTEFWNGGIPFVTPADLQKSKHIFSTERTVSHIGLNSVKGATLPAGAVCVSCIGNLGYTALTTQKSVSNQQINSIIPNSDFDNDFVYYLMKSLWDEFKNLEGQSTTLSILNKTLFSKIEVLVPEKVTQQRIAQLLSSLDDKIELNAQINHNLEEQAKALYDQIWDNYDSGTWSSAKAEDLFDISIGKTPPRKESQWFSEKDNDIVWVSIADMGQSGCFISNSSEYLTPDAVSKFNVKRVPAGAILLSFKLTVGRVAITGCELTTNEAIAHFRMEDSTIREYLYFYLKHFNYQTMGSTSSIATAVNSKMVKAMRIDIPARETLENFHSTVFPMFEQIEQNQQEIQTLAQLRDTLLPKLMSGELDVSEVEV